MLLNKILPNKMLLLQIPTILASQIIVGAALLLTAPASVLADAPKPPSDTGTISIQAALPDSTASSNSQNLAAPSAGHWDAGSISALDEDALAHEFSLKNTGTTPLTISRLQTSCGCTSALPATEKGLAPLPLTLAPGQTMTVQTRVNLAMVAPSQLSKSVMLYSGDNPRPIAALQITGTLRPSLALSPSLLDFGQVAVHSGQALIVTATWDERLTPGGTLPPLVSTNPDITVLPQPEMIATPSKRHGPSAFLHRGIRTRTYRVAVSPNASLGPLSGTLAFRASATQPHAAIYAQPSTLLLGQVQGDLTAQPQSLLFGSVRLAQPASREIVLIGTTAEALKNLHVSSASPWLEAHLSPSTPVFTGGQFQSNSQVLDVSLRANAPPGFLTSTLKITLANGQHLRVPVTANVGAAFQ